MRKLTNYERDLHKRLKNPAYRKGFVEEYARVKFAYQMMQLRKRQRISQAQLAKKLGTTQSVVARIEAGQQNLTLDTLQKIASAFRRQLKIQFV